jgi:hypothetical protein
MNIDTKDVEQAKITVGDQTISKMNGSATNPPLRTPHHRRQL